MMDGFTGLGKGLILLGLMIIVVGVGFMFIDRVPFLGRLPGDLRFQWKNVTVYAPVVTCLVLSLILTVLLNLFFRR